MNLLSRIVFFAATALAALSAFSQSAGNAEAKLISMREYVISPEAKAAGIDGELKVALSVNKEGNVDRAVVIAGPLWPCGSNPRKEIEQVREGVVAAVKEAKFSPAMKNGKPQGAELQLTVLIGERYEEAKRRIAARNNNSADGPPKIINGGVLNGKVLNLPKPEYPPEARANRASGAVQIEVMVDEQGKVVMAGAVGGNPLLQQAARDSACNAKFAPTLLSGQPIKISGIITYNFVP